MPRDRYAPDAVPGTGGAARAASGELAPDDAAFVAWLERSYRPAPLSPTQLAAFNTRLYARIERPRRFFFGPIALAGAAAAALLLALVGGGDALRDRGPEATVVTAQASVGEALLAYTDPLSSETDDEGMDYLPDDYALLAGLLADEDSYGDLEEISGRPLPEGTRQSLWGSSVTGRG